MRNKALVLVAIFMSGCASWPDKGMGGWAESFHYGSDSTSSWYSQPQGLLQHDFDHLSLRLEILRARGIQQCMPAQLKLATLMHNRIQRQMSASMFSQSQHDIVVFYHQINLLQTHFNDVSRRTGCANFALAPELQTDASDAALALLNSDNQFAFNDDQVTPKYRLRIKQAAELLLLFDDLFLLLVGHTDAIGSVQSNLELGQLRASNVGKELIANGLSADSFTISSQGESVPFSTEQSLSSQLSNRRVVAYILSGEPAHHNEVAREKSSDSQSNIPLIYWTKTLAKKEGL